MKKTGIKSDFSLRSSPFAGITSSGRVCSSVFSLNFQNFMHESRPIVIVISFAILTNTPVMAPLWAAIVELFTDIVKNKFMC